MLDITLEQMICLISIVLAIVYRIIAFNKIKKKNATKEGREYISSKGGKIIILLEVRIFIMIIILIFASILNLNLLSIIPLLILAWVGSLLIESKARK